MNNVTSEPATSPEKSGGYNFGTFAGVYTPAVLAILGLVMFMRTNYVLGSAGLINMLLILAAGASISLATALSISIIATNTEVKGGGAYYLISRVLGPSFGTSIGLVLFLTQVVAVPFNVLGASEALIIQWPMLNAYFPWLNLGFGLFLVLMVWVGSDWSIRMEYVILFLEGLAILFFLLGPIGNFSWENFSANLLPAENSVSMIRLFAIFFPAVTGIMAGVSMSGDLKEPHRSIPRGTLAALITAIFLYFVQIVLAAGCFTQQEMIENPYGILVENALFGFGFIILIGVQATTLSTALGWMLGAPRVLQRLGADRVLPGISFFQKTSGKKNEPRRAIVAVALLIAPVLLWTGYLGQNVTNIEDSPLNLLSRLVSLFFLFANAIINIAAFVEVRGGNPSFRPRFHLFHWSIAVYGAAACVLAAFLIDLWLSLGALIVIAGLYLWTRYRNLEMGYGDARRGFVYSRIHSNLLLLPQLPLHPKNWRPAIAILTVTPERRGDIVRYASLMSQKRGILSVIQIIITPRGAGGYGLLRENRLKELRELFKERHWQAFPTVVIAPEFDVALQTVLQSHSLDPIQSNIIMMGWPRQRERIAPFFSHLHMIVDDFRRSVLILANGSSSFTPQRADGGTIDIWWQTQAGGSLMTILAYLVHLDRDWRKSKLRIFLMDSKAEATRLRPVLEQSRINAEIINLDPGLRLHSELPRRSRDAELVFIEFNEYYLRDERRQQITHYLVDRALRDMPPCFLAISNGEADLLA